MTDFYLVPQGTVYVIIYSFDLFCLSVLKIEFAMHIGVANKFITCSWMNTV